MDSLTHTVIGACLGEAIAGKQLGKKAMLIGALANNLPDIDVITSLWASQTDELLIHRGITHSILVATIFSPLLAFIFQKIYKKYPVSFKQWLILFGSGMFLHIFIDAFTTYGTGWFEPFMNTRVSFNALFILDPLLTLPVLIATIALLFLKTDSLKRRSWAKFGIGMFAFYLLFASINKIFVNGQVEKNLSIKEFPHSDFIATPTPLNNLLWYIIVRSDKDYYIGYYSIFDKNADISFEKINKNDTLLTNASDPQQVKDLIRFSQNYYCLSVVNDTIVYSDMRFGQLGGWYKKNAPFVYNFNLARQGNNKIGLQKARFDSFSGEAITQLFKRMGGKQ